MTVYIIVKSYDWGEEYGSGWEIDEVFLDEEAAKAYAAEKDDDKTGYGYRYTVEKKEAK